MRKILFLTFILKLSLCQRRITNGSSVDYNVNTHFMVSIVSAKAVEAIKGWLCSGTIIHPSLILTAASCLHIIPTMYVIAGYRRYVRTEDLDSDICTRHMKKRIINYCMHSEYGLLKANQGDKHTSEERKHKWTIFDIGIARIESPIDFFDHHYTKYCSYLPNSILVNFHKKSELPGSDAVIYGWGHAEFYRPEKDKTDYNSNTIRFTSTKIMDNIKCQERYQSRYLQAHIHVSYLCTDERGHLDAFGRNVMVDGPEKMLCTRRILRSRNLSVMDLKLNELCNNVVNVSEKEIPKIKNKAFKNTRRHTRRNGICQNDHGSPLIRWIGGHPYILGVASAFQVTKNMECVGPYLFTSTHCTSRFIHCIMTIQSQKTRRAPSICDAPDNVRGYKIEETVVNWDDQNSTESDYGLFDSLEMSACQRRITNGSTVDSTADTSFVVYIVAASTSDTDPGWLCGGSIIHPSLVLTSAACLTVGTQKMYVIAGYRVYVRTENLENDECTRRTKKKIVSYCTHYKYAQDEEGTTTSSWSDESNYKWTKFDIAVARTDTPIDFYDTDYKKYCSYLPSSVRTNYNSRYERPMSDVVVYGWGHAVYYRPDGDLTDYNAKHLKFASSIIMHRQDCMHRFNSEYVARRVKQNFVCADDKGNFDSHGKYLYTEPPTKEMCKKYRRHFNDSNFDSTKKRACLEFSNNETSASVKLNGTFTSTRRNGICQNDHGGPLVRWIGGHPFVIGIASAFHVNKNMECVGPYLYSSVICTSQFINCQLEEQSTLRRTVSNCSRTEKGYKVEETYIDWSKTDITTDELMTYEDLDI